MAEVTHIACLPDALYRYRQHDSSASARQRALQMRNMAVALERAFHRRYAGQPPTNLRRLLAKDFVRGAYLAHVAGEGSAAAELLARASEHAPSVFVLGEVVEEVIDHYLKREAVAGSIWPGRVVVLPTPPADNPHETPEGSDPGQAPYGRVLRGGGAGAPEQIGVASLCRPAGRSSLAAEIEAYGRSACAGACATAGCRRPPRRFATAAVSNTARGALAPGLFRTAHAFGWLANRNLPADRFSAHTTTSTRARAFADAIRVSESNGLLPEILGAAAGQASANAEGSNTEVHAAGVPKVVGSSSQKLRLAVLLIAGLGMAMVAAASWLGVGTSPNSAAYVGSARNF